MDETSNRSVEFRVSGNLGRLRVSGIGGRSLSAIISSESRIGAKQYIYNARLSGRVGFNSFFAREVETSVGFNDLLKGCNQEAFFIAIAPPGPPAGQIPAGSARPQWNRAGPQPTGAWAAAGRLRLAPGWRLEFDWPTGSGPLRYGSQQGPAQSRPASGSGATRSRTEPGRAAVSEPETLKAECYTCRPAAGHRLHQPANADGARASLPAKGKSRIRGRGSRVYEVGRKIGRLCRRAGSGKSSRRR